MLKILAAKKHGNSYTVKWINGFRDYNRNQMQNIGLIDGLKIKFLMVKKIIYNDVICEYIRLNKTEGKRLKIPSCKFNNFISDYMANKESSYIENFICHPLQG